MSGASAIRQIPIAEIEVLNPRARNRRVFDELVQSIAAVDLKRPITVTPRADGPGYELVCGQGRMEAFSKLGATEIPAVVVEASREDCFLMGLVENLARRNHSPMELIREVGALRTRGYGTPRSPGRSASARNTCGRSASCSSAARRGC